MTIIRMIRFTLLLTLYCKLNLLQSQCIFEELNSLDLTTVFLDYEIQDYINFKNSLAELDVIVLITKGGSAQFTYLRLTKLDKSTVKVSNQDTAFIFNNELEELGLSVVGSHLGFCPYSSSNDSFIACVRINGELYFSTHLIGNGFNEIPFEQYKSLIKEVLRIGAVIM